eukprot:TRINITY_DN1069_c0_g1_i5.p1 TRINITY_DN1069_c0_g1~~TRINITY_DN1069_c0_g1_i5.p1  ORF type:complete len:999 (-),score=293.26 TRINITY_DN1069_c0_g1_i5:231-3176(-)
MAQFKLSVEELTALHQSRDNDKLVKLGGVSKIAAGVGSDIQKGIPEKELTDGCQARKSKYGKNFVEPPIAKTLPELIWEGLQDSTLIMLCIASFVSLALGLWEDPQTGWIEGTAILIAVVVVVLVSSLNDYHKEIQFRKLNEKKNNTQIKVIRAGEQRQVSIYDINVGDVVGIETGDIICADGLVIDARNIRCDESAMTGETDQIKKDESHPFLLSGTQVTEGFGKMLVIAVGKNSESGRAMALLSKPAESTPLQEKLEALADKIAYFGLGAAVTILVILIAKFLILNWINGVAFELHMFQVLVKYFITSITIVVVAVPEGLPLAVTIALAFSMMKMLNDQNLVRHLDSCETMGGATTICSDKTGTLTKNVMTVMRGWIGGQSYSTVDEISKSLSREDAKLLSQSIAINSTAYEGKTDKGTTEFIGSKTECALLNFAKLFPGAPNYKLIRTNNVQEYVIPFSSARKRMSTVVKSGSEYHIYTKGASEIVLNNCTHYLRQSVPQPIPENLRKELAQVIEEMAANGLRTLCLAYKTVPAQNWEQAGETLETGLICLGIVGIKDPVRDEVPAAVRQCQKAGIVVRMVTGDNITTAKKIAEECGILTDGIAIEGPAFRALPEAELDRIIPRIQVMARSSPEDKYKLVTRLKLHNHVVAVTGDGTNDAPALKAAHVGFSMGIAGTEVAKEASDIILMDDNFSSLVKAVMWGRNVYDSIRKFLQFQLTVNVVAVSLAFIGAVTDEHGESPLKPVQLLWVNLIMDTMAALALATEPPSSALLDRKPYGKHDPLITRGMWKNIIGQAIYQLLINLLVLYRPHLLFDVEPGSIYHITIIFNTFVMCQLFNEINSRKLNNELNVFSGLFDNAIFLGILGFTLVVQWIFVEFGGDFTSTRPLTSSDWFTTFLLGAGGIPWGVMLSLLPVKEKETPAPVAPRSASRPAGSPKVGASKWNKARTVIKAVNALKQPLLIDRIRRRHSVTVPGFGK